tara:strand:- start:206 stop:481 length:276 start_codon:yes stop_codon:yes gene_type:complete
MTGSLNKWGKSIQYSISNETSWMLVSEGAYNWVYITKRDFKDNKLNEILKNTGTRPDFVKKKEMRDLLIHFGIDKDTIQKLFKKIEDSEVV